MLAPRIIGLHISKSPQEGTIGLAVRTLENLGDEGLSAEQEIAERLKRMLHMDRWWTWRERVWHDFDQVDLEMDLPNGYVLGISLERLRNCPAGADGLSFE